MEQNNSSANKLAERSIADARSMAEKTMMEANMQAMGISADSAEKCGDLRRVLRQKRDAAVESVLDGSKTRASIDGKKKALQKKRSLIDMVFERTYQALCALSTAERGMICEKLLRSESEGGETVVPAAADRTEIARILSSMENADLSLSEEDAPLDGGFLLIGKGYEKDCSFRAILSMLRDTEETAVANLIFE